MRLILALSTLLKKEDIVGIAEDLNTTVEHVQSIADSWLMLEQFAEVSGKQQVNL